MTVRRKAETDAIAEALDRYRERLNATLEASIQAARAATPQTPVVAPLLDAFYGQIEYHFGWRDANLQPHPRAARQIVATGAAARRV